ncbi:MAG TPA: ABC transporter ATP-binding protein [Solirubrobacteraceae bacterium]|nr:ABC transporter ATP-binding protein [Solirubrobacteraceae bacterium]
MQLRARRANRAGAGPGAANAAPPPGQRTDEQTEFQAAKGSLRLIDVHRSYGAVTALGGVSFDIPAGEFVTILGPSGSGKTTVMRIVGGFVAPDAGRVEISGRDATNVPPFKRDTNTVFQSFALFPHMTVEENVAFGLKVAGVSKSLRRQRVAEMLALVDLPNSAARFPGQLSGGMRQRVALARALVKEPSVLLLDEPLAALDRKLRESMQFELRRIQRQLGMTFVYVTHDQDEALSMADRVIVMRAGLIEQIGAPDKVYDLPRTLWVGSFVGGSNQLSGLIRTAGAVTELETDVAILRGICVDDGLVAGRRAVALVRPEHVFVSDGAGTAENTVGVVIEEVQHVGSHLRYVGRTPGGIRVHARAQRYTADARVLEEGSTATFSWSASSTRIYVSDEGSDVG